MLWDTVDDPNGPVGWGGRPFSVYVGPLAQPFGFAARMTAMIATDDSGFVEYYFECSNSAFSSGWIALPTYQVPTGRSPYWAGLRFRVKARDAAHNETGWSTWETAHQ